MTFKIIQIKVMYLYRKLLIWMLRLTCRSQRKQETRSSGTIYGEGDDLCQLQLDAFDEAAIQADAIIQTLQERAIALMECQMLQSNSESGSESND